jgi:hypothetical protein
LMAAVGKFADEVINTNLYFSTRLCQWTWSLSKLVHLPASQPISVRSILILFLTHSVHFQVAIFKEISQWKLCMPFLPSSSKLHITN